MNRYAYCRNNPVKFTDPSGHGWLSSLLAFAAAVIAVICTAGMALPWVIAAATIAGALGGIAGAAIEGSSLKAGAIKGAITGFMVGVTAGLTAGADVGTTEGFVQVSQAGVENASVQAGTKTMEAGLAEFAATLDKTIAFVETGVRQSSNIVKTAISNVLAAGKAVGTYAAQNAHIAAAGAAGHFASSIAPHARQVINAAASPYLTMYEGFASGFETQYNAQKPFIDFANKNPGTVTMAFDVIHAGFAPDSYVGDGAYALMTHYKPEIEQNGYMQFGAKMITKGPAKTFMETPTDMVKRYLEHSNG